MERFGRGGANALTATTNVEQLGDVTVTLAKRGHKGSCPDDGQAISDDMCRVAVTLPMVGRLCTSQMQFDPQLETAW
jgi:hypothetical protein